MFETTAPWRSFQKLVRAYWKLILVSATFGGLLGGMYLIQTPPAFKATAEVVTGTYSLPAEVGTEPAVDKAGPLGLELPAETQARIIASPAVADIASRELGLDEVETADLPHQITATPTTDNTFAVRVEGPTPEEAASRANAVANAYLQYRKDTGKQELESLAARANDLASDNIEAARALDGPIDAEVRAGNSSYASVMLSRRQELERTAAAASSSAAAFGSAAQRFDGGGSVLRPATSRTVASVLPPANVMAFGVLAGVLLGIGAAAVRRQFGNVKIRVDDIRRSAPEIYAVDPQDRQSSMQLMLLAAARSAENHGIDPAQVLVRPLTDASSYGHILLEMMRDSAGMGRTTVLRTEDPSVWDALGRERHNAPSEWEWSEAATGGTVKSRITEESLAADLSADHSVFSILVLAAPDGGERTTWRLRSGSGAVTILIVRERKDRIRDFLDVVRDHATAGMPVGGVVIVKKTDSRTGAETAGRPPRKTDETRGTSDEQAETASVGELIPAGRVAGAVDGGSSPDPGVRRKRSS